MTCSQRSVGIINLRNQASHGPGNVTIEKTKSMPVMLEVLLLQESAKLSSFFPNYAKSYASTINKGLTRMLLMMMTTSMVLMLMTTRIVLIMMTTGLVVITKTTRVC